MAGAIEDGQAVRHQFLLGGHHGERASGQCAKDGDFGGSSSPLHDEVVHFGQDKGADHKRANRLLEESSAKYAAEKKITPACL